MRLTIAIGILVVLIGGGALYTFRTAEVMAVLGGLAYRPPADSAAMAAAFAKLGAEPSHTPGVTLAALARARLACVGAIREDAAREAFLRANLVMLGAGAGSFSPLIPPEARRLAALRPDLAGTSPTPPQPPGAEVAAILDRLGDSEAAIHRGLTLSRGFAALELRDKLFALAAGGGGSGACAMTAQGR